MALGFLVSSNCALRSSPFPLGFVCGGQGKKHCMKEEGGSYVQEKNLPTPSSGQRVCRLVFSGSKTLR